ncbi:hypothetical protein ACXXDK_11515 [Deinococcus sp. PESE-38]
MSQPAQPSVTRRLYGLLTPYRAAVGAGLLLLLGSVAAELYPPLVWIRVVDQGIPARDWELIGGQLAVLVGVFALQQVLSAWRGCCWSGPGSSSPLTCGLPCTANCSRSPPTTSRRSGPATCSCG